MTADPDHGPGSDQRVTRFIAAQGSWAPTLAVARDILLAQGLAETVKWGQPCYTHGAGNIVVMGVLKTELRLGFFKGALIQNPALLTPGPHTRAARHLAFRNAAEVEAASAVIRQIVAEAKRIEESGLSVDFAADAEPDLPPELVAALEADPELDRAFSALTPGRRRYWVLHIGEAQHSATRQARITRVRPRILAGQGVTGR